MVVARTAWRRVRVHLDLHGEDLVGMQRQPQLEEEPRKAHERAVHHPPGVRFELDHVALALQVGANGPQVRFEVVAAVGTLQSEVQVL
jgi:hypothetical protein